MPHPFEANQQLETLKLKIQHLADYLDSQVEIDADGYIDEPYFNTLVYDIKELHDQLTP